MVQVMIVHVNCSWRLLLWRSGAASRPFRQSGKVVLKLKPSQAPPSQVTCGCRSASSFLGAQAWQHLNALRIMWVWVLDYSNITQLWL